jgi:FkbM family methyltransferase
MNGFKRDGEFAYDLDHTGEEELISLCLAERGDAEFVFFDVGANRGDWTDYLMRNASMPVNGHLFEISKSMFERLEDNVGHYPGLTINNAGLSHEPGTLEFRRYPSAEGVNSFHVDTDFWDWQLDSVTETAVVTTGDRYCETHGIEHIDLLKIDTEGWEWNVLRGFSRMLSEHRISVVQFEYGYLTADLHVVMKDFWRLFNDYGYSVGPLYKQGVDFRNFIYRDNDFREDANYVAILPFEERRT